MPLLFLEHPVAADAIGLLEAVERDAPLVQRLGGRDPGGAGADQAYRPGALPSPSEPLP